MNDLKIDRHCGRILVVDDTSANLLLLTNILTEMGYSVYPASDGELALEFVRTTLPDLILLDIRMPGMDGFEVCRRLKSNERTSAIPVIFISGLEDDRDKVKGFAAGGVDYITKPFYPQEVLARIDIQLRLRVLTEQLEQKVRERTAALLESEQKLRQLNDELEKRVAVRTQELSSSHAELKQAYNDLKIAQSRILQQEKMASIGQLAAGVAHEINNPLGFVLSNLGTFGRYTSKMTEYITLLEERLQQAAGLVPESGAELLAEIELQRKKLKMTNMLTDIVDLLAESVEGCDRMKQIVTNLKSFARQNGDTKTTYDIKEGLESTLNLVWNELKYKAEVHRDYSEIPKILCNPGQLNQVFMNLLVNAAQSIEDQGEIRIATRLDNGFVTVSIEDTGCGIPADTLARIFEPFFTTKDVGKGTGLGLSIAYEIVKNHHGEISVESEVGRGTRFVVHLPVQAVSNETGEEERL